MKNRVIFVVGALMLVGAGLFWFIRAEPPEKLRVAEASQHVFALVYIAEAKGYFDDADLEVEFVSFTSGRDALTSVIEGKADIATVLETPVILRAAEGIPLSIISTLHTSTKNTVLVARRDHGINAPADLAGKRIAVSKNTNGEFFLWRFLVSEGIDLELMQFVDTKPPDMVAALLSGSVDGVATWNPHQYDARMAVPDNAATVFRSDVYTETSVLAGTRDVVATKSKAFTRLLRALHRAEAFLADHKEEAIRIVVAKLSQQKEEMIRAVWDDFEAEMKLDNLLLTVLRNEAKWFREQGKFTNPVPNFTRVIFSDYLKEVNPRAVTLLE